tara:strand:- start:1157 stop:1516 length:360 start_codon:yes stop_codon:yes gene_type:complete
MRPIRQADRPINPSDDRAVFTRLAVLWNNTSTISFLKSYGNCHYYEQPRKQENPMNWDQIAGRWKQVRGHVKREWGRLTEDDVDRVDGQREKLVGLIQEAYGIEREEADRQIRNWFSRL